MRSCNIDASFLVVPESPNELKDLLELLNPEAVLPVQGTAVPTFHCVGLYWSPPKVEPFYPVRYRPASSKTWLPAYPLWADVRSNGLENARGSIVNLAPDTDYVVQFGSDGKWVATQSFRTWSERLPEQDIITVGAQSTTYRITRGGTPGGYVVYEAGGIDVGKNADACISVETSYVIVRGLTLRNARKIGVQLRPGVHDVWVDGCDISNWGSFRVTGALGKYGNNYEPAVGSLGFDDKGTARIIVQRNKIHDPSFGSNDWDEGHPAGPQGIQLFNSAGNHVFRYNELFSTNDDPAKENRWFNDGMGGGENDSAAGFPGRDSDIYQNSIRHTMDDSMELEGSGSNVRAFDNFIDNFSLSVAALNVVAHGPVYIWRNVSSRGRGQYNKKPDDAARPAFVKCGSRNFGNGRAFIFHNTAMQVPGLGQYGWGINAALDSVDTPVGSLYARNNIFDQTRPWRTLYYLKPANVPNDIASNLSDSTSDRSMEKNAIAGSPLWKPGHGPTGALGNYQLSAGSPGKGVGEYLPNFSSSAKPDVGASDEGMPRFKYGVSASR